VVLPGVNFTNILQQLITPILFRQKIAKQNKKEEDAKYTFLQKAAHKKMLVKLTPDQQDLDVTWSYVMIQKPELHHINILVKKLGLMELILVSQHGRPQGRARGGICIWPAKIICFSIF